MLGRPPIPTLTYTRFPYTTLFRSRPPANPHAEAWVRQGDADGIQKGDLDTARLTLDITPAMRARIKVSAFTQGVTVAELLRALLEREFPERRTENLP